MWKQAVDPTSGPIPGMWINDAGETWFGDAPPGGMPGAPARPSDPWGGYFYDEAIASGATPEFGAALARLSPAVNLAAELGIDPAQALAMYQRGMEENMGSPYFAGATDLGNQALKPGWGMLGMLEGSGNLTPERLAALQQYVDQGYQEMNAQRTRDKADFRDSMIKFGVGLAGLVTPGLLGMYPGQGGLSVFGADAAAAGQGVSGGWTGSLAFDPAAIGSEWALPAVETATGAAPSWLPATTAATTASADTIGKVAAALGLPKDVVSGSWDVIKAFAPNVVGAYMGSNAAEDAANTQVQASREAMGVLRGDLEPWRTAGAGALRDLVSGLPEMTRKFTMADFTVDPGYDFRVSEGEKAINRGAQARGMWDSGATMKALTRFNQDTASDEYGKAYSRFTGNQQQRYNMLSGLSGSGQNAAAMTGQGSASLLTGAGNAQAAGQVGSANAWADALSNSVNAMTMADLLAKLNTRTGVYGR